MTSSPILEEKVHYLGTWQNNRVDNAVIADINAQIVSEKGSKVKLQLSADGLRIVKNTVIQGKMLQDYVPAERIQLVTVSQRMGDLLIVISASRDPAARFQVQVFRCRDVRTAAVYVGAFQKLQRTVRTVTTATKAPVNGEGGGEINWTLRSKQQDNSKRELKKLVDLHGEKAIVHKTNESPVVIQNGHVETGEIGVRTHIYRKGKPARIESTQSSVVADERYDGLDSRSEVSESALRSELENLSQELRDIKLMLEQSTGVASTAGSEPGSPRDFKPVDVKVTKHTVVSQPETVVIRRTEPEEVHAVVLDDDDEPVQMRPKTSGYHVTTTGNTTHVRVSVPDYRNKVEEKVTNVSNGGIHYTLTKTDATDTARPVTMSYDSWKQDTLRRNAVQVRDLPERIQWKSRASNRSHVVSVRPRSALPSFSGSERSSQLVQVRHEPAGYGPVYHQRSTYNPYGVRVHDRKTQSLRTKGISTTIQRPIEKVYTGHPEAKHHSLVMRSPPSGTRPSILVKDGSVRGSQVLVMEENNNVVKPETNDHNLLDVSGLDLYRETPAEVTVTESAVIRT